LLSIYSPASYAVSLNGLDMLAFTGGIGENSVSIREQVCSQLGFLGVTLDPAKNRAAEELISKDDSKIAIRIVAADEDGQIARHTRRLLE
jgi:acetate kinase